MTDPINNVRIQQDAGHEHPARKRRPLWPFIIVGLLATHVTGMVIAFTIAQRDSSFLVVPNYYDKAQHWDQARAEQRASEKLGWQVKVNAAKSADEQGRRLVSFVLTDAAGLAPRNASLRVDYFHHAHPDQQRYVELSPDSNDARRFTAMLPMRYAGIWELHFTATAGGQTYVTTQTEFLGEVRK